MEIYCEEGRDMTAVHFLDKEQQHWYGSVTLEERHVIEG